MIPTVIIILLALGLGVLIGLVVAAVRRSYAKRRAALQAVAQQSGWTSSSERQ
jgi:cyanate permease